MSKLFSNPLFNNTVELLVLWKQWIYPMYLAKHQTISDEKNADTHFLHLLISTLQTYVNASTTEAQIRIFIRVLLST